MDTPKKAALFISPHLDDAVFSCGGTLAKMRAEGWRTILCTIFTKSFTNPRGFALACQLDKNLSADVDYMKLRRAEDIAAARILNVSEISHLNLPEAPHRGYDSAPELFAGIKSEDKIRRKVTEHLALMKDLYQPSVIFAPQGFGNHCDHLQTIESVLEVFNGEKIYWYYDTPYIIRQPDARRYARVPARLNETAVDITKYLILKIKACAAYRSQINFQFGGLDKIGITLTDFHRDDKKSSVEVSYTEKFLLLKK